jgi:uncharacterized phage protein gp47/JayE
MAINYPQNPKEVVDRIKASVQSALPSSQPFIPNSTIGAIVTGLGGRAYDLYQQLKELQKQMFPDTAIDEFLKRWGSYVNVNPNAASKSTGLMTFTGTVGTLLPASTPFVTAKGNTYLTDSDTIIIAQSLNIVSLTRNGSLVTAATDSAHNLATGMQVIISGAVPTDYNGTYNIVVTSLTQFIYAIATTPITPATTPGTVSYNGNSVAITSVDFGEANNLDAGAELFISTGISGIDNVARVQFGGIGGGTDAEKNDDYRKRVLFRYQNPHALFNKAETESKCKEVAGVTHVWSFPATPVPGDATFYFIRANDEDIIPTPEEVAAVKNKLLEILPMEMETFQLHVYAPTPVPVDFTFIALTPNTTAMQDAIQANLNFFFRQGTQVGESLKSDAYRSVIYQTRDESGAQVESFSLSSPSGDVAIGTGEIAKLGEFTFP